jgi:uncharacterized membrane protein YvbJ
MYCTKCGAKNVWDDKFCHECGEMLNQPTSPPHPTVMGAIRRSRLAVASMVLGIVGFLIIPCAILGIIFGAISINQMGKGANLTGKGTAIAGLMCGIIVLIFWVIVIVVF